MTLPGRVMVTVSTRVPASFVTGGVMPGGSSFVMVVVRVVFVLLLMMRTTVAAVMVSEKAMSYHCIDWTPGIAAMHLAGQFESVGTMGPAVGPTVTSGGDEIVVSRSTDGNSIVVPFP